MMINPLAALASVEPQADLALPDLAQRMQQEARTNTSVPAAVESDKDEDENEDGIFEFKMQFPQMHLDLDDDEELKVPEALPMLVTIRLQVDRAPDAEHKTDTRVLERTALPPKPAQSHISPAKPDKESVGPTQATAPSRKSARGAFSLPATARPAALARAEQGVGHHAIDSPMPRPERALSPPARRESGSRQSSSGFNPEASSRIGAGPGAESRSLASPGSYSPSGSPARSRHRSNVGSTSVAQAPASRFEPLIASADIATHDNSHGAPKQDTKEPASDDGLVRHDITSRQPMVFTGDLKPDDAPRQADAHSNAPAFATTLPQQAASQQASAQLASSDPGVTYQFRSLGPQASVDLRFDANTSAGTVFATPSNDQVRHLIDASLRDNASAPAGLQFEDREERGDHRRHPHPDTDDHAEEQDAG